MTACSIWLLPRLEINQNFSHYFPEGDEELLFYRQMTAELGDEDDLLAVAVYRNAGIFDSAFLQKVHAFALACDTLPWVKEVQALTMLDEPVRTPFGFISIPFIHLYQPAEFRSDSLRINNDPRLAGRFVSKDMKTLVVNLQIEQNLSGVQGRQVIVGLEHLLGGMAFEEVHIVGRKYFEVCYNRLSNKELKKGVILCLGIIALFLGWMYRSVWGVMLPMLVFIVSIINFFGYFVLIHRTLNASSNLFPTIILISGLSDAIHLFSNYEDKLNTTKDPAEAMTAALNEVGLATFLTAITTAVGFLTFAISPIPAIRWFGLDVAFGVMLTYVITHILVPAVLVQIKKEAIRTKPDFNRWWSVIADRLFDAVLNRRKTIIIVTWALLLLSLAGIYFINTNNLLVSALPRQHVLRESSGFFEKNLTGVRTFEVAIQPVGERTLSDLAVLNEVEKLHTHLDTMKEVGNVYSPTTYFKSLNKSWFGGNPAAYRLPENEELLKKQDRQAKRQARLPFRRILNEDRTWGKISARIPDMGRQNVAAFNRQFEEWLQQNINPGIISCRITGASLMVDKVHEYSIANLRNGLLLDALAIGILIALALKQWRMVFITLITNIYPLFMAGALMGLTGVEMRFTTSIIFIIGLVIATDDTTHFLSKYMIARIRKVPEQEAVRNTLHETGRPVIITFGVLFLSFAILIFSDFRDSQAVGILVSFLLLCGVLADLFLLPLLLIKAPRKEHIER